MTAAHRRHKDAVYDQLARVGKALASPERLELLDLLCQAPRTVEELAELAELGVGNASQHLKQLREARLVESSRRGLYVTFRVASDEVSRFLVAMRGLAEAHLAELPAAVRRVLGGRQPAEPVDGPELVARVRRGEVVVLDVRPSEEYIGGHVPGARSMPLPGGAGISGKPSTTIGFERRPDRDEFIAAVADVPPRPAESEASVRDNRGRSVLA